MSFVVPTMEDAEKVFGKVNTIESAAMAKCACVACNSCTCACSCRAFDGSFDIWE